MSEILKLQNLQKTYGTFDALKNVSFTINKGEIVALLGPNGAGKSTTMKILLGLRHADHGTVAVPAKEKIGYAGQDLSFPQHLKTVEVLKLVKAHFDNSTSVEEMVRRFELQGFLHRQLGGLSGGEKRRVSLACALMGNPELLVLDEPTTGLDVEARMGLWKEMSAFASEGGTILVATHDLNEVSQIADRVIIIDQGQVLFDGPLEEIKKDLDVKTLRFKSKRTPVSTYIEELNSREDIHHVLTAEPENLLKDLFTQDFELENLEVTSATLEEAFIHLRRTQHEKIP